MVIAAASESSSSFGLGSIAGARFRWALVNANRLRVGASDEKASSSDTDADEPVDSERSDAD